MLIKSGKQIPLGVKQEGRELYLLTEDFIYITQKGAVVVPRGFVTDRASIPTLFWFWKKGNHNICAIVHDYLYVYGKVRIVSKETTLLVHMNKQQADELFYAMLLEMNTKQHQAGERGFIRHSIGRIEAFLMYAAVSLVGGYDGTYANHKLPNTKK